MTNDYQRQFAGKHVEGSAFGARMWSVDKYGRLHGSRGFIWRPGENIAICKGKVDLEAVRQAAIHHLSQSLSYTPPRPPQASGIFRKKITTTAAAVPDAAIVVRPEPEPKPCKGVEVDCECGFYAFYEPENDGWKLDTREFTGAAGIIEGYGMTTQGVKGFRAAKAKIVALVVGKVQYDPVTIRPTATPNLKQIQRNYPDVAFFDTIGNMFAEFPPSDPPLYDPDEPGFWERK